MFDKKERNMLFPDQSVNFNSAGPGSPHLQNTDFTPSSYFMDINILETSKTRKFMNLDSKRHSGVSPVLRRNNQYYEDNFAVGQQAELENINKVLFSNLRQAYFQQKEPSFFHETFKEEISKVQNIEHIERTRQPEQSGFQSHYSCDLLSTSLHAQDKQQGGMIIPHLPVALEFSTCEQSCLGTEKVKNNVYTSMELENIYLGKQEAPTTEHNNQPLVGRNLCVNASLNTERLTEIGDGFSGNLDEQNKPTNRTASPVNSEKIWAGSLKLNTSTTVSTVAFFKSGEKVQDLNWPEHVEIKGKVRLHAFEKFIQELPRSRNRALMVISLCWKVGSCRGGLAGMMEVAKGYRETEKVGFAQIPSGIDLYVCPRSDIIITILAKYGFFKGMAAVEEDQDSLIGCVVWRRSQSSANSVSKAVVGKNARIQEQPLNSTGLSIQGINSPAMDARDSEQKQVISSETELKAALNLPGSYAGTSIALTDTRSMITENKAAPSSSNSNEAGIFHCSSVRTITSSIPYSCPLVPAQQKTSERPLNLLQESMKPAGMIPLAQNSIADEAVLVSDSWTKFVSSPQMAPAFILENSLSSSISQNLENFGSSPAPGPRPLIPVDSSNFQFQPQAAQKTHSSTRSDSNCDGKNLVPSFQATEPALPEPSPSPLKLLHMLIQSNENLPKAINGGMLQDEIHIMHHMVTRGPTDVLERRAPSLPQIQETRAGSNNAEEGSNNAEEEEDDDDDDLPEFDFNSACGEPDAMSRFPGCSQQTHFRNAPPLNEKLSFEAIWSARDPTPIATSRKSFEALQHRPNLCPFSSNLLNSNEGLSLDKNFGKNISEKTPSTKGYQLTCQRSCLKEAKDLDNDPRHGFCFERKSLWDDEDDDMPEWCPPDLELPEQPLPSATTSARLLSRRPPPPPDTTSPSSFQPCQSQDLQQRSQPGLLGPRPKKRHIGGFVLSDKPSKPPLGPRRRDSFRHRAAKFSRRPSHDADRRRHRR